MESHWRSRKLAVIPLWGAMGQGRYPRHAKLQAKGRMGSGYGSGPCLLATQMRARPDLLLGLSFHEVPFLAVAGRVVLR
eukprot:3403823-Pleurochrysis_carterae.AAC.1